MRSDGPKIDDPRAALADQGFALGKRIGAGQFGEVYIAVYAGDNPKIKALVNKDGELVIKIAKKPTYEADKTLSDDEQKKARKQFDFQSTAAAKTNDNEFNIIAGGLSDVSLSSKAGFLPRAYAESVCNGEFKFIYNELVKGVDLEKFARQLGVNELTRYESLALQAQADEENDEDLAAGNDADAYNAVSGDEADAEAYGQVSSDEADADAYGQVSSDEADADAYGQVSGDEAEADGYGQASGDEEGYGQVSDDEDNVVGGDEADNVPYQPPSELNGIPLAEIPATKTLIHILNALEPMLEKFHLLGFAHNDFAARNIMVVFLQDGGLELKLLDFGLTLKLDKDGKCIDDPRIAAAPEILYGQLDKDKTKGVLTDRMSLQMAKIEVLANFMGYLSLPPTHDQDGNRSSPQKNVIRDIHAQGLKVEKRKIDPAIGNAERLANSVANLERAARELGVDPTLEIPTRDPRGVIVEHIVASMRHELLQVPVMDAVKYNAFTAPAATTVQPKPVLSVNAAMHQAIGANKTTAIRAPAVEGVDENKKVSDNVNSSQRVAPAEKEEAAQAQAPGFPKR
jgi:serine/threonine protein kinase